MMDGRPPGGRWGSSNKGDKNAMPYAQKGFVGRKRRYMDVPTVPYPQVQPSSSPGGRRKRRRLNTSRLALILFLLFLGVCGGAFAAGYYYYTNIQQPLNQFIRPVTRGGNEPGNATGSYDTIRGRSWNMLLLGSDNDGKYDFPAVLTQVMMVVHVDTDTNSVSLVSIPRDSWVIVPEVGGMHKIDQAFFLGVNRTSKFEDGVRLARLTIEQDYGIPIDRYGWVGLDGFARVIDTLGGVDIDVTHPVLDDTYPDDVGNSANAKNPNAYKRIYLAPGPQHLNGQEALEYVRSRHGDLVGDIGRTERQQQVLQALKLKLNATSIVEHLPELLKDMQGKLYTDLSQDEMVAFANFGRSLDARTIQRLTLGPGKGAQNFGHYASVYDPSAGSNQDVIIPNCDAIQPVINRIFGLVNAQSCNVTG